MYNIVHSQVENATITIKSYQDSTVMEESITVTQNALDLLSMAEQK
jgi:hypothetical protein